MNFFNLNEFDFNKQSMQSFDSDGIGVDLMSSIFMDLSKTPGYETTEGIKGLELCYYENEGSIKTQTGVPKTGFIKKRNVKSGYALVEKNAVVEFSNKEGKSAFFIVLGQTLHASINKADIENYIKLKKSQTFATPSHKAAYEWLESGEVGTSSLTLCAAMFPDLKHRTLQKHISKNNLAYPHDFDDFGRCYKFIQTLPDGKERLKTLSLGTEWSNIISNWSTIESGFLSKDQQDREVSYNLLQRCIGRNKKLKS